MNATAYLMEMCRMMVIASNFYKVTKELQQNLSENDEFIKKNNDAIALLFMELYEIMFRNLFRIIATNFYKVTNEPRSNEIPLKRRVC